MTMPVPSKISNSTVIPLGYVEPGRQAGSQLSEGVYSLNKRSNVPYVTLIGAAGYQKTITWGEPTSVPKNEMVSVKNDSYHGGDIFINKDTDICNRPSRITIPVSYRALTAVPNTAFYAWQANFPCDVRGAKRAYLMINATAKDPYGLNNSFEYVYVRGRKLDGSMISPNMLALFAPPYGPATGFLSALQIPVGAAMSYIPLGEGALLGDDSRPHMLLDAHDVFLAATSNTLTDYMQWPIDYGEPTPAGNTTAPPTWYIVEYD